MAEYIKREVAEKIFSRARMMLKPQDYKSADEFNTRDLMLLNAEQAIHMIHTADVKPVVHGEWVKNKDRVGWHCSVCQKDNVYAYCWNPDTDITYTLQDKFCPNCGADMRGCER